MNRPFTIALGISLAGHAVVVGAQVLSIGWTGLSAPVQPRVIYDAHTDRAAEEKAKQLYRIHAQLAQLGSSAAMPAGQAVMGSPGQAGRGAGGSAAWGQFLAQLTEGRGISRSTAGAVADETSPWVGAVDLTNLASAASGNPVLMSYFGAIREQIQRTADQQGWLSRDQLDQGVIYVGFVIARTGRITQTAVLKDRPSFSPSLGDAAVKIVRSSSPFPEFPPSSEGPSMAFIIPIEFVLSSEAGSGAAGS